MKTNTKRSVAVLFALITALAAIAGGGTATVPTVDTSAADATTTTSEIVDDAVFQNVSGTNDNETYVMQTNVTPDDTVELKVQRNDSDTVVHRNTSPENVSVAGPTNNGAHYNLSFVGEDIDDMTRTLNENVTVDVTTYDADNESAPGDAASAGNRTTATIFLHFDDDRTVLNIDDDEADEEDQIEVEDLDNSLFDTRVSGFSTFEFSVLDVDERDIGGEGTDVVIVFSNGTVADHAADAVASDADDGDPIFGFPLLVSGDETTQLIRVYNEEPADDVDDDDDGDTYGVYHDGGIGGEDGIVIHLGEDFDDDDEVEVTGTLNAGLVESLSHRVSTSGFGDATGLTDGSVLNVGTGPLNWTDRAVVLVFLGAPVARRRPVEDAIVIDEPGAGQHGAPVEAEG